MPDSQKVFSGYFKGISYDRYSPHIHPEKNHPTKISEIEKRKESQKQMQKLTIFFFFSAIPIKKENRQKRLFRVYRICYIPTMGEDVRFLNIAFFFD